MKRGDVYYADLRPVVGSEQGGVRPVLIIQNDVGNRHSPTVICAAITSRMNKAKLPTHIELNSMVYDMEKDSVILLEQLRTIDKKRLKDKICHLDGTIMQKVNRALMISLELGSRSTEQGSRSMEAGNKGFTLNKNISLGSQKKEDNTNLDDSPRKWYDVEQMQKIM